MLFQVIDKFNIFLSGNRKFEVEIRTVVLVARFYFGVTVLLRKYAMLGKWACAHALLSLKCTTI